MTLLCTLHQVKFSAEPTLLTKEEHKKNIIPQCPVCIVNEMAELRIMAGALRIQRDSLAAAIEIKQAALYITV